MRNVVVVGRSMSPTLEPGDRLLLVPVRRPKVGALVAARDPRHPSRVVVKRVGEVLPGPEYLLVSDHPEGSTIGPVPRSALRGRAVYRYFPPGRAGRVRM